jgi:methylmalonyl-CoA/ethylmalonyl-CoA epimerase
MKISHIDHIGIAVKSIEEALPYYENVLGLKCYAIEEVEEEKVRTAFLKIGDTKLELLEPMSEDCAIAEFLVNKGQGIQHIAYAVEDGISNALEECKEKKVRRIDNTPRKGAQGKNIAFLNPRSTQGVLTELCGE